MSKRGGKKRENSTPIDDLTNQPPNKRQKLNFSSGSKVYVTHEESGISIEIEEGEDSANLFIFLKDETWEYIETDKENLQKLVEEEDFVEKNKNKVSIRNVIEYLVKWKEDMKKKRKKIFKVIIYYSGHGELVENEQYPSFKNELGQHINTKELYEEIRDDEELDLNLIVLVADMCSCKASKSNEKYVRMFPSQTSTKIGIFDFQGHFYVRTSQEGRASWGNKNLGSFFTKCFVEEWQGSWIGIVEMANLCFFRFQVATGVGNLKQIFNRKIELKF